ncbi:hypothetical protein TanjilG_23673 [Lupinus angustifolius]|uniref:Late embryogenesis abundant protein LEA-2 subgroup domain-containing protein n=1 Tax=Lupinus angustifolius TaxID=3871 RepID=A0A4P1R9V0_LUPAN|nr:hypothetical protein TanjilG_23673 [Lupinus angustifolius]
MDLHNKDEPLYAYPFFVFLGEWLILVVTCSIALFFFPFTPSFTLHSTTSSVLNYTAENNFKTNLGIGILIDDSNSLGTKIYYDSLHISIFQDQKNLSTFSLPNDSLQQQELAKNAIEAEYYNVSVKVDEWCNDIDGVQVHGTSCGFVYLDLWFSANARYMMQPMWPSFAIRDKLQGHCGNVKVKLCSSSSDTNTVFHSFLVSCDVHSVVVHKVKLVLFTVLIFLLVIAVALNLLIEQFFCSSTF